MIGIPTSLIFQNPRPGENFIEDHNQIGKEGEEISLALTNQDFSLTQALHTWTFWLLGSSLTLRLLAQHTLMVHIVPILVEVELSEAVAAVLVALVALSRLPTSLTSGFIADRWSRQKISAIANLFGALACVTLLSGPPSLPTGILFAILFGTAHASNAITWALIGQFFGRKYFGTIRGIISLVPGITTAFGPILAGWSYDQSTSYTTTLVVIGFLYISAAIMFWLLKSPRKSGQAILGSP